MVPGLAVMSVVALMVGTRLENRDLGIPRMRSTRRTSAGKIVSGLYGVVVALGVLIFAIAFALLPADSPLASPALAHVPEMS